MLVSSAGPPGEISTVAPNIQELDLSGDHLLASWQTVGDICGQLQQLRTLNVSENFALSIPDNPCTLTPAFRRVTELSINKMQLSWSQMCGIVSMFPDLEKLYCCQNLVAHISSGPPLGALRVLTLEENQLTSWASVLPLASLPQLETLILNDNQISEIPSSEGDGRSPGFQSLKSLSICRNCLHSWSSILTLDSMPALREVKVKGNPLFEGDSDLNSRQLVIARLPRLEALNGSPVTKRERVVAERFYLTKFSSLWAESRQGSEDRRREFEKAHPRYTRLADAHNIPLEVLQPSQPTGSLLKNSLLSVTISCPEEPEARQLAKRLPGSVTVQKLKGLLQRVYRVDTAQQRLSYLDRSRNIEIEWQTNANCVDPVK
jgi:Leucine-rich repeat (LRR) protein